MKTQSFYTGLQSALFSDLGSVEVDGPHDVRTAARVLMLNSLLKKSSDGPGALTRDVLETRAFKAFEDAEEACRLTNRRFSYSDAFSESLTPSVARVLVDAKRQITSLLSDFTYVDLFSRCGHGPGVSVSINADQLGVDSKYDESRISVSRTALPIFRTVSSSVLWPLARGIQATGCASLLDCEFRIEERDNLAFVPKSATSLRSITIGPTANVYLQLGVGRWLSERLKRWGLDLSDQTLNSGLARLGSKTGSVSTLDLKAASDHLSLGLVRWLLGDCKLLWVLEALRSTGCTTPSGGELTYQKFSGMGNGFTFPLQTMVFHALSRACCNKLGVSNVYTATYGDDIIVPRDVAPLCKEVLSHCGFTINDQKSFIDGPFRESCGGQYYDGHDIRPVYWKGFRAKTGTAQEVCKLAHQLVLWCDRCAEHPRVALASTLAYLETVAWKLAESEAKRYNQSLKRQFGNNIPSKLVRVPLLPYVPVNAPVGSGFPKLYCALDEVQLRVFTFTPYKREARDAAMYAFSLDGGLKYAGRKIHSRNAGEWVLRKQRLFLGKYAR